MTIPGIIISGILFAIAWGILTGGISNLNGSAHKGNDEE